MRLLSTFVRLSTLFGALAAAIDLNAASGDVRFLGSDHYVYESQGSISVSVQGVFGTVQYGANIAATYPAHAVPTTAVKYSDYSETATFSFTGANNTGFSVLTNLDSATRTFTIGIVDDAVIDGEKTIGLIFYSTSRNPVNPTTATVHILDDDFIVSLKAVEPKAYEAGRARGQFVVSRNGGTAYDTVVNLTRSGTATFTTDYTLQVGGGNITDWVVIPAGNTTVTIDVVPADDGAPESQETVELDLAAGYYAVDQQAKDGVVNLIDNDPVLTIAATDASASESGDSGLFTISRTADTGKPLQVHYLITGTAGNGVDYSYLSNSVAILAGEAHTTVTVAPLKDLTTEAAETVILTLVTNGYVLGAVTNATVSIADFDDNSRTTPLIGGGINPAARYGRFTRGAAGASSVYHSFLIPIDFQQGVVLDNSGGNASTLFPGIGWSTSYNHYNATNPASPIAFSNPIASFGNRVGGSPLYFGQPYTFGIYAGDPSPQNTNTGTYATALRIKVYNQSNFSLVTTTNFPIPHLSNTNEWLPFLTNGYIKTVTTHGLTTTLSFNNANAAWSVSSSSGNYYDVAYHLTHTAATTTPKYIYLVELSGGTDQGWLVKATDNSRAWSPLYTIEFEDRPAWRSLLVKQPQFFHQPLPPGYLGRSAEELLTINPPVTNSVSLGGAPTNYLNLDHSPELRRHHALDELTADLGNDPLLLVNYVLNEIELTDAIDYNDNGVTSEISVNLGGVKRGALGTYLEGQGSPTEQCALLVYLLRKANYPAVYVFPPDNGLKLIDSRLSKLLRTQVRNAVDNQGKVYATNSLISVNYPWVATYIGTNWVHVFPWLKDTQVESGFDMYSFMPPQYDNALKWARGYAFGDTNILSVSPEDDSPLTVYPKFIEKMLRENAPGMSVDDLGIKAWNRRHYYSRWSDLPTPTSVTNVTIAVESLGHSSITNVSPALTNIFDTVSVEISSVADPSKKVSTGELRLAEIHNRRLVAWHEKVSASQHTLRLSLAAFRTNLTTQKAFSAVQLLVSTDTNILFNLVTNVTLLGTDDDLNMTLVNKRHRSLPGGFSQPAHWSPYLGFTSPLVITNVRKLRKGDLTAICINAGRVTRRMLDQHANEIWLMERAGSAGSTDKYQGSIASLMGMSYFEKVSRFNEYSARLHEAQPVSFLASGLALLRAKRDASGALPNGDVIPVQPVLDMFYKESAVIGNGTVYLDSGDDGYGPSSRLFELTITAGSALEHVVLNHFYKQSDSVSTVRLLQMAARTTDGVVTLAKHTYVGEGEKNYPTGSSTKLKDASPAIWTVISNVFNANYHSNNAVVFMTPGRMASDTRSFKGTGALVFSPLSYYALISESLNGGYGPQLPDSTLSSSSLPQTSLKVDTDNNFFLDSTPPVSPGAVVSGEAVSLNDQSAFANALNNSQTLSTPEQQGLDLTRTTLNLTTTDRGDQKEAQFDNGVMDHGPRRESSQSLGNDWFADPVNVISGEFYIDTVDLRLSGPMSLEVRRNYSSLNVFDNEFGYGWKLNYMPFLSVSADANQLLLHAAEADGAVITYRRQTNSSGIYLGTWTPRPQDNPRLKNAVGTIGNPYNTTVTRTTNASIVTYTLRSPDGGVRTYPVKTFSLGGGIDRTRPYLERWQDSRSNYFHFYYGTNTYSPEFGKATRVESSNGNFLGFNYDIYGHVIEAFTGDGRRLNYEYDDYGDLIRVELPDASEIKYEYAREAVTTNSTRALFSTHLLVREEKPDGRVLQNDYDKERRVINQYATAGYDLRLIRNASFAYSNNFTFASSFTNLTVGYTLVHDHLTNAFRYEYTNGLITRIVDPLSRTNIQAYYADNETNAPAYPRSLKQTIDPRGLITDYKYDPQGNATNVTVTGNLLGDGVSRSAATVFSYNANRLPTNVVDAVGNRAVTTYTNSLFPFLMTSQTRYASNGTLIAATLFEHGNFTNASPIGNFVGSFGLLKRQLRAFNSADAATNEFAYDPRGFLTREIRYTGTTDPAVTNHFYHNLRGELVQRTDGAGRSTLFSYTPRGDVEWREVYNEQGVRLAWDLSYYNLNGELTWSDGPRFDPEDYVWHDYDGQGRKIEETRWRTRAKIDGSGVEAASGDDPFSTTFYEYDPSGNLVKVIDPRGHYMRLKYDAMGQLRERRSYDGKAPTNAAPLAVEGFAYEPGGKVAFATNALGGVTETQYTSSGLPKFRRNPDGSTNGWLYYLDGRLEREIQNNGAYGRITYNDADRITTRVFFNAGGTPLATNITELDRRGNLFRRVDALGFAFTNVFDGLDRLKRTAGPIISFDPPPGSPGFPGSPPPPMQEAVTNYFDAFGIATTNINALGDKSITYTDALGRITRSEVRDKNNNLVLENSTAYAVNHHSVTTTNGAGASAIIATTYTDNAGRTLLSVAQPNANLREFARRAFDAAGNPLVEVRSSLTNGVRTDWTTATFGYDGLNRLIAQTNRDSAITTYAYNAAGNLTNRTMPGGLKWVATYDNAGRLTKDFNLGNSGSGARTNTYTYYSAVHAFAGLPATRTDARGVVCTYVYDAWLRPLTNTHAGPLDEQDLTTIWQYDARGVVTNITENFALSATGPTSTVARAYSPYGHLADEMVLLNGVPAITAHQSWNSAGRRNALGFGSYGYDYTHRADGRLSGVTAGYSAATSTGTYAYNTAGLLTSRTIGPRVTTTSSRDGAGRPLSLTTTLNGTNLVSEALTYSGDGLIATHIVTRPDFTDSRAYFYASQSRRLIEERLNLDATKRWTNVFAFDAGTAAGPGVLTKLGQPQTGGVTWGGGADVLLRTGTETNNAVRHTAYGNVNGVATVSALLDGVPMPVIVAGTGTNGGQWRATLELTPGTHQLVARARHPSGQYTATSTNTFTNIITAHTAVNVFDHAGQLTQKIWKNANGTTNRTQTLAWDARGRLVKVTERDSANNGRNWSALFDPLGRRLRTTEVTVTNNVALTAQPLVIDVIHDPMVEFQELAVSANGQETWRLQGPDLDGSYGGQNGLGGWDAITPGPEFFCPTITDARGNVLAVYDVNHGSLVWNASRPTAYGAVPGYRPPAFGHGASLVASGAWRGRWADSLGYHHIGARAYAPENGSWLSFDPVWNDGDPTGYGAFGGDPVNYFDPDGRMLTQVAAAGRYYGTIALGTLGGTLNDFDSMLAIGDPSHPRHYEVTLNIAIQSSADYQNGGEGWEGTRNAINRYNPMRSPFEAVSGTHLMDGPQLGDELTWDESAVAWANTISLAASLGAGAPGTLRNIFGEAGALSRTQLLLTEGTLESRVSTSYQQFYNEAWQQTAARFNQGEIVVPAGQSWQTILGRETDAAARAQMRMFLQREGISEGAGGQVLLNRRLNDPSGSGAYRIPDVNIPGAGLILDGTIGTKTIMTPQIQDFINWSGSRVNIVSPTVLPGFRPNP